MRITNKIIQNNSLNNINTNKTLQDQLSTMLSSNKKIARPSDDPIIALRSLRLRTSVNQVTQYVEKNVEDAKSWLTVTEDSIDTLSEIITDIRKQYVKGTSDTLKSEDRTIITDNLKALAAEIYNTGNADFAGRSVFTGFRTDTTLTFQKQENIEYTIDETMESLTVDSINYVTLDDDENNVVSTDITRVRLSYDKLDDVMPATVKLNGTDIAVTKMSSTWVPDPYQTVVSNPSAAVFVPETGEILLGSSIVASPDDVTEFEVSYKRSEWKNGDLRPEHYFNCVDSTNNKTYSSHGNDHEIEYNIGVNQSLRINTTADECFNHCILRDLQDIIESITRVDDIENTIKKLKADLSALDGNDPARDTVQAKLDAAEKAQTYLNNNMHTLFSKAITKADGYLDKNNVALTDCGTRSKRLELIENRLDTQLGSLKELKSENEDADLAETAIQMKSAEYAYNASLMATSQILQQSLLNYI